MEHWRIARYTVSDFMRLTYVDFVPKGRMIVFTGKNSQGKSSALQAIPYVLAGLKWSPDMPTRRGAVKHKVELHLENGEKGAFTVTRTQSGLKLEMAPGCKAWGTPQQMLDSIYEELTLDPIQFIRMGTNAEGKRKQVDLLKGAIVLDVDLDELAQQNKLDFEKRREINREIESLKSQIAGIPLQPNLPDQPIDIDEIQARIREANESNKSVIQMVQLRQHRENELAALEGHEQRNQELITQTHATIERITAWQQEMVPALDNAAQIRDQLEELQERARRLANVDRLGESIAEDINRVRGKAMTYLSAAGQRSVDLKTDLETVRKNLMAAESQQNRLSQAVAEARLALEQSPQPEMVDTAALSEELNHAQMINREIEKRDRQNELIKKRQAKESESGALTRAMERREEEKRTAVANAKMPIEGLTFTTEAGKEEILYNGVPIAQQGEAQQLRISIAIALARKPKLRIVRIPHGEALDDDSMIALAEMAEQMDFYVWMAKVDASGKVGIFLEDGEVKAINETPPKKGDLA